MTKTGIAKYGVRFYESVDDALSDSIRPPEKKDFPSGDMSYVNEIKMEDELGHDEKKSLDDSEPPAVDFSQEKAPAYSKNEVTKVDIETDSNDERNTHEF